LTIRALGRSWLLLWLLGASAFAAGEQNGRLSGMLIDEFSGAPIGGAQVVVSGPSLIGQGRVAVTETDGSWAVSALPPGRYRVEIRFAGARPLLRDVVVRLGEPALLALRWSPELTAGELTVVSEERHLTRPGDAQTGTVVTQDQEARLATPRTPLGAALQVAGLTNNNDKLYGNPEIKGGSYIHNRYLVDGFDITDPVSQLLSADFNFDSLTYLEILTGGMEAQYNSLGGVVNLVTRAGSDELHLDAGLYVDHPSLSAAHAYGSRPYQGVEPFNGSALPSSSYQAHLNVSGPLVRGRLWGSAGVQYDYLETANLPVPPLLVLPPSTTEHRLLLRGKLTYAPSSPHRLTLSVNADPDLVQNSDQVGGLADTAGAHRRGSFIGVFQYEYLPNESINFTLQAGYEYREGIFGPQGRLYSVGYENDPKYSGLNYQYDYNRPAHTNQVDGSVWYNSPYAWSDDRRHTAQLDPSLALRGRWLGHHDAKIGLQTRFVWNPYTTEIPGGRYYLDDGGGPGEAGLCDERTGNGCYLRVSQDRFSTRTWGLSAGLFLQDRWKIGRFTLLPGLRLDWGITRNSVDQTVSNLLGAGPRLGVAVDLFGDGRTIFSAFYGRANEVLPVLEASYADVQGLTRTDRWNGSAFVPLSTSGGPGGYRLDPHVTAPHTDEITLSLRRELLRGSLAGIDYTWKRISNIWDKAEINQIWDPTGQRVIGYVDGRAEQVFQFSTFDGNYRVYHGIDFYVEAQPTPNWDIYAAYTLSWLYGAGAEQVGQISGYDQYSPFYNPRQTFYYDGFLPEDTRHHLKLRASYSWHGLSAGVLLRFQTGAPLSRRYFQPQDGDYFNLRSPQGTDPGGGNDVARISEFRLPSLLSVDVRLSWDLHPLLRQHIVLIADLFNLFDLSAATGLETSNLPTFATVTARQPPFRCQLGARYSY
jgi:hypothetical protein